MVLEMIELKLNNCLVLSDCLSGVKAEGKTLPGAPTEGSNLKVMSLTLYHLTHVLLRCLLCHTSIFPGVISGCS